MLKKEVANTGSHARLLYHRLNAVAELGKPSALGSQRYRFLNDHD